MTLDAIARAWAAWMAPVAWQAAVVGALVLAADTLLLRRAWPQVRAALWLLVVGKLVLPPSLASPASVTSGLPEAPAPEGAPVAALLLWAIGAAAFLAATAWRARAARRRLLAAAEEPSPELLDAYRRAARVLGVARPPRLLVSSAAPGPCVFGALRTVVALPPPPPSGVELEHVLLHELAHVKRRDLLAHAALALLHALYWFHPVAWIARARLGALREVACDGAVAAVLRERTPEYRRTLLRAAGARALGAPGLGIFAGQATILLRLRWLETNPWRTRARNRALALAVAAAFSACVLPMAKRAAPEPAAVLAARAIVRDAAEGRTGDGCLRVRYAVLYLKQAKEWKR